MIVLGLSAFVPGAAAALLVDGHVRALAREEDLSHVPNDATFPRRAARSCLLEAGIAAGQIDAIAWSEKPLLRFEHVMFDGMRTFPRGAGRFAASMQDWLGERLWIRTRIASEFGVDAERIRFVSTPHAHAAAAFLPSGHATAAIVVDGCHGEASDHVHARGDGARVQVLRRIDGRSSIHRLFEILENAHALSVARLPRARIEAARAVAPGLDACGVDPIAADGSFDVDATALTSRLRAMDVDRAIDAVVGAARCIGRAVATSVAALVVSRHIVIGGDLAQLAPELWSFAPPPEVDSIDTARVGHGAAAALGAAWVVAIDEFGAPRPAATGFDACAPLGTLASRVATN